MYVHTLIIVCVCVCIRIFVSNHLQQIFFIGYGMSIEDHRVAYNERESWTNNQTLTGVNSTTYLIHPK